jgi:CRP-like cAMP-binding protein
VFGQVSLIAGAARSATCTLRTDAVILEIEQDACERLLSSRSTTALKFLAVLNEGLIAALRGADLRLMQIQSDAQTTTSVAN